MNIEELLLCKAQNKSGEWVCGLLVHQDTGYQYTMFTENEDMDDAYCPGKTQNCTELAIQSRDENGYLTIHTISPETLCRFTGMIDKNKNKIFEYDVLLTQPFTDKPHSSKAKSKRHEVIVKYVSNLETCESSWGVDYIQEPGKYQCCNWNEFYESEIIGNWLDKNRKEEKHA